MAFRSKAIQAIPGTYNLKNDFSSQYSGAFISYPITDKWELGLEYIKSKGWTSFSLEPDFCSGTCGHGSARIRLHRFGVFAERQLLDWRNIFRVTSYLKVIYENAAPSGPWEYGELQAVNFWREESMGPYTDWAVYVQPLQGKQILPGAALRLNLKLFWRLYAHFEYGFTVGHREYQKLYFENHYLGEPGVTGVWSSNGTLKYKIWGLSLKFMGKVDRYDKGKFELF